MILTQCPVCAAALPALTAKQCSRCKTRYCGPECQVQHWKEGGHDQLCKKIKKAGGAEQYNANKKYAEAVTVAAEACAEDTKGQTCYICTQALHWKTKEGLVRGCSCRGTAGFAHVSCLAEQAEILVAEAEDDNLDAERIQSRWDRWHACSLCEQEYHGVVKCALGWACWKTYVGRPETDQARGMAMTLLGTGLHDVRLYEDSLSVKEAELSLVLRIGDSESNILAVQTNLACTYATLGRREEALSMERDVYFGRLKLNGEEHETTLRAASNYASSLQDLERFEEARALLRKTIPLARRIFGNDDRSTIKMRQMYAKALYRDPAATLDDLHEAATLLEEAERTARRVLGGAHPLVVGIENSLRIARVELRARASK
jgi:tetratricopeptide (TPR) repeat protein